MQRRAGALRREVLDHCHLPLGRLAGGLDRGEDAQEPERLTLVLAQCDWVDGGGGGGAHRELLPYFAKHHVSRCEYPTPRRLECQVSRYSMYHHSSEPLLSAQAPR